MPHRNYFRILFWVLIAIGLLFAVQSSPAQANLIGSNVTFASNVEYETGKYSASCYQPGEYNQFLCFNFDTTSLDGQDADSLAIQFPSDWDVRGRWITDHYDYTSIEHSCTNGGTMAGATSWAGLAQNGQYLAGDGRIQNPETSCHALYCFSVWDQTDPGDPPYDDEQDALISWSWVGPAAEPPSSVCSSDGLYPQDGYPCELVSTAPPATVPVCEFVPITILPETLPHAVAGQYYTQQLSPIPQVDPVTGLTDYWYTSSTGMPDDFALYTNTGEIEWGSPQVGSYTFTAYVEGLGWSEGSREYTIVVDPLLVFDPDPLPAGRQNTAYNQPITVSGGTAPYTLILESGTLPSGMSFTGDAFVGTPTEFGTYIDLIVRATDANGVSQTHNFTLTVYKEHIFTWTPTTPASGENTVFTADSGFDYYQWSYGYNPDGDCSTNYWGNQQEISLIFYAKGNHKVCLHAINYSPYLDLVDEQWVTVLNGPPMINYAYADPNPSFPGQSVEAGLYFHDSDGPGNFTCEIDWGDGSTDTVAAGTDDWSCAFPSHAYESIGIYEVTQTVTDDEGAEATTTIQHEVVWLFSYDYSTWLVSNTLPTTIRLWGYAPEGTETLQFDINEIPAHGSLGAPTFNACETCYYMPQSVVCWASVTYYPDITDPLYVGSDNFDFTISDNAGHTSMPATVELWVDENEPPTAEDGTAVVHFREPSEFQIFGTDMDVYDYNVDELIFILDTLPQYGTLEFEGDANVDEWFYDNGNVIGARWGQSFIYTPNPGITATTDSFTFHINDGMEDSNVATFTLTLHTPTTLHVNVNDDLVDATGCDNTHCSLREAVANALIGDTIDFTLSLPNTITLTDASGGELLVNKNIYILGPGADQLSISAGFMDSEINPWEGFRVIHIYNDDIPMKASLSGLTIRDGRSNEGGGMLVDENVTLTISDCVIGPNNIVSYAGGGLEADEADVTMTNCTVVQNHGTGTVGGAGIFVDDSVMTIINSTVSGNVTNNYGAGIYALDRTTVTLINSTVSENIANQNYETEAWGGGGGIYTDGLKFVC